jgi:hypothetical protein
MVKLRVVLPLLALLLSGCGPILVALGLDSALEDDTPPDNLQPSLTLTAPEYVGTDSVEIDVEANKPVTFEAQLEGPEPSSLSQAKVTIEMLAATRARLRTTGSLIDGEYDLTITIRDPQGRTATKEHAFTVDKRAPGFPIVFDAEASEPRSINVRWVRAFDRRSEDNEFDAAPSGVVGYKLYYDVAPEAVTSRALFRVLDFRSPIGSPIEIDGADTTTFKLTGLASARLYRVRVTAVDAAGNESIASTGSAADDFVVRTRAGGDGTFDAQEAFQLPDAPNATVNEIEVADLDRDGIDDLIVLDFHRVLIYRGTGTDRVGDGAFALAATLSAPDTVESLTAVEYADVGGDGVPDVVASGRIGELLVWDGTATDGRPDGGFGDRRTIAVNGATGQMTIGDIEGDGSAEIVVVSAGTVIVIRNETFQQVLDFLDGVEHVLLSDQDGDSDLDLIVSIGSELRAIRAPSFIGEGPFQASASAGGLVSHLAVGDLDGDPYPDIVVAHLLDDTIGIIYGKPPFEDPANSPGSTGSQSGLLQFEAPLSFAAGASVQATAIADFDNDGADDIAVASFASGPTIQYGEKDADGNPARAFAGSTPIQALSAASAIAVGDFNGDGIPDFVLGDPGGTLQVLLGSGSTVRGDGSFAEPQAIGVEGSDGLTVHGAGDADGDGIADFYGQVGNTMRVFAGLGVDGQGDSTFVFDRSNFMHNTWDRSAAGDFDNDGTIDFCGVSSLAPGFWDWGYLEMQLARDASFLRTFSSLPNLGHSFLDNTLPTPAPVAFDANDDGVLDLFVAVGGRTSLLIGPMGTLPGPNDPNPVVWSNVVAYEEFLSQYGNVGVLDVVGIGAADMDRDGEPDLLGVDLEAGTLRLALTRDSGSGVLHVGGNAAEGFAGLASGEAVSTSMRAAPAANPVFTLRLLADTPVSAGGEVEIVVVYGATGVYDMSNRKFDDDDAQWIQVLNTQAVRRQTYNVTPGATSINVSFHQGFFQLPFYVVVINRLGVPLTLVPSDHELRQLALEWEIRNVTLPGFGAVDPRLDAFDRPDVLATLDLDHDDSVDVVALHPQARKLAVLLGTGDPAVPLMDFTTDDAVRGSRVVDLALPFPDGRTLEGDPIAVRVTDHDADGVPDLVGFTRSREIFTLRGEDGRFRPWKLVKIDDDYDLSTIAWLQLDITSMAIADFNSDGTPDLVLGTTGPPQVMLGSGKPTRLEIEEADLQPEGEEELPETFEGDPSGTASAGTGR